MRLISLLVLTSSASFFLCGCGDGGDAPTSCNWSAARLMPTSAPPIPTGQDGELASAIVGAWQHTYTIRSGGAPSALNDTTDIRFVFPSDDELIYCQHITGIVEVGPNERRVSFTLDGTQIQLPGTAGYNAVAWSEDVMLWDNNTISGEQYVLERR